MHVIKLANRIKIDKIWYVTPPSHSMGAHCRPCSYPNNNKHSFAGDGNRQSTGGYRQVVVGTAAILIIDSTEPRIAADPPPSVLLAHKLRTRNVN